MLGCLLFAEDALKIEIDTKKDKNRVLKKEKIFPAQNFSKNVTGMKYGGRKRAVLTRLMSDYIPDPIDLNATEENHEEEEACEGEEEDFAEQEASNQRERIDKYRLLGQIDRRWRSKVFYAIDTQTHLKVIIKYFDTNKKDWEHFKTSVETMKSISHPNIVSLIRVLDEADFYAYVMEVYKGGDLFFKLHEGARYSLENLKYIMWSMIGVVSYLHQLGYVHGNISLDNILLKSDSLEKPEAVLTGFSRLRREKIKVSEIPKFEYDVYVAPEVSQTQELTSATDIYALGNVFYFLLIGRVNKDESESDIEELDSNAKSLLSGMLNQDKGQRYTISDCMKHPFFEDHLTRIGKTSIEVDSMSTLTMMMEAINDADQYMDYETQFTENSDDDPFPGDDNDEDDDDDDLMNCEG